MNPSRLLRGIVLGVSGVYLLTLAFLTFNHFRFGMYGTDWVYYVTHRVNFVPFSSIAFYVKGLMDNTVNPSIALSNLLGAPLLYFPLGFLAPCLFIAQRHCRIWFPTVLGVVIGIELIQLVTMTGVLDIDSILLHFAGAALGYGLWSLLPNRITRLKQAQA